MENSILFFGISLIVYFCLARCLSKFNRMFLFISSGLSVGLLLICWEIYSLAFIGIRLISVVLLYACLCEFYIFLMGLSLASISASILIKLQKVSMSESEIEKAYSSESMVLGRLERLLNGGYLSEYGGSLQLTEKGKRVAGLYRIFQRFFQHDG